MIKVESFNDKHVFITHNSSVVIIELYEIDYVINKLTQFQIMVECRKEDNEKA